MKGLVLLILLAGCASEPVRVPAPYEQCEKIASKSGYKDSYATREYNGDLSCVIPLEKHQPYSGIPKYKAGDCIELYGSRYEIEDTWIEDYAVLIGPGCKQNNWLECSVQAYSIQIVDENSVQVECSK